MKNVIKKSLTTAGVFLAAGAFGAAFELFLDSYFHLTEPLAGWYWFWSFFHRFKFYAALGAATGGCLGGVGIALAAGASRVKTRWRLRHPGRLAFGAAFAPALAAAPLWYILANKPVTLPTSAGVKLVAGWAVVVLLIAVAFYQLGRISAAANNFVRRVLVVGGYAAALVYVIGGVLGAVTRVKPPASPDVVIITLDTCRADEFGPRADGSTLTPNIDRFARAAVVFTHCRSQASWTSPSLATLHTGQYPMVHYATADRPLGTSQPTLAESLRDAGYETRAVVANRLCHRPGGLARGFYRYQYWDQNGVLGWLGYYETYFYYLENRIYEKRNTRVGVKDNHTTVISDRVVDILKKKRRRPLFLWCHFLDPHSPYSPPRRYVAAADRPFIDRVNRGKKKNAALLRRLYNGEVRYVDDELARVFAALPADAVVVISSDHGEEFWEHGDYDHGKSLYEEVIRVPLVMRLPGVKPGVSAASVGVVDIAPTILSYLGLKVPVSMQGRDIARARDGNWDYPCFTGSSMLKGARRYCVVYRGRKLIVRYNQEPKEGKYFDLRVDPAEQHLLKKPDAVRPEVEALLAAWVKENWAFAKAFERGRLSRAIRDQMRAIGYIK